MGAGFNVHLLKPVSLQELAEHLPMDYPSVVASAAVHFPHR
jgi:hypothetical protein